MAGVLFAAGLVAAARKIVVTDAPATISQSTFKSSVWNAQA